MIAAILLFAAAAAGEADAPPPAAATRQLYDEALAAHGKGNPRKGAALFFQWLRGSPRTAEAYDSAQHLLAEELHSLGLLHAALVYETTVIRSRARPELLPAALDRLQAWAAEAPHDEDRFEAEALRGGDFGGVEGPVKAYVAFEQGAADLRAGQDRWSEARFAELPESSPFRFRARLLTAAVRLSRGGPAEEALHELHELATDKSSPREVRNEARISAARLRFEAGEFEQALQLYDAVDLPELDPGRGQIYLEEAWTHYRAGQGGKAMGLLAALEAPSFRNLFLPEKFLLRALIYKDACHWLTAKRTARGLLRRYAGSLQAIQDRLPLLDDAQLAEAALQKGAGRRAAQLVAQLAKERDKLDRLASAWKDSGLWDSLAELYAGAQAEAERKRQLELERGVIRAADELLRAAEQVSLVDYEVGLALYRRARQAPKSQLAFQTVDPERDEVAYGFDGEYWNDELPALRFGLKNRCAEGVAP
jgi:hypothetical protein